MRVAIIGAGRIGGGIAAQAVDAGHDVLMSFSRDPEALRARAEQLGASAGTPAHAVAFGELVVLSVPWGAIDEALAQAGSLEGRLVVDTTNQFGPGPKPAHGQTAAAFNRARMPGARYAKCFNTLTSGFQAEASQRTDDARVVQWIAGDDEEAIRVVAAFVESLGFVPVVLAGTKHCAVMEAPRRDGSVYGEEYRAADAQAVVDAVRGGRRIPPTPQYA